MDVQLQTINITPLSNPDGTYTLRVSSYELNEIIKAIKYMDRQRENARKYKKSKSQHVMRLNVNHPASIHSVDNNKSGEVMAPTHQSTPLYLSINPYTPYR